MKVFRAFFTLFAVCALGLSSISCGVEKSSAAKEETDSVSSAVEKKLDTIVFPEVQFEDVALGDVVPLLEKQSKRLSPDGIGISVKIADDELFDAEFSLEKSNATLKEILDEISRKTDSRYVVTGSGVEFICSE